MTMARMTESEKTEEARIAALEAELESEMHGALSPEEMTSRQAAADAELERIGRAATPIRRVKASGSAPRASASRESSGSSTKPSNKGRARARTTPDPEIARLKRELRQTYAMLGMIVGAAFPLPGLVLTRRGQTMANAVGRLAETDPRVKKFLLKATRGSVYAAVVSAHAPLFVAIGLSIGAIPGNSPLSMTVMPEIMALQAAEADGDS